MKYMMTIGVIILFIGVFGISEYNALKQSRIQVDAAWGQTENQMQRRFDLIPNLVETTNGYMKHEQGTLQAITEARSKMNGASTPQQKDAANAELTSALSRLMVVVENYPTLKSDAHFTELMHELSGTENRIAVARKDYNDAIRVYNVRVETFPSNVFASMMGYTPMQQFKADEQAKTAPKVQF